MDDISTVTKVLHAYYTAFSSLDADAVAPFFHLPCIFISPLGVDAAPTQNDVKDVFRIIAEGLGQRAYKRSELTALQVKRMSDSAALATGVAVRYKVDGDELERVGVTYLLHKTDERWTIAVTVVHDAGAMD
jgi:ketosteroid isomerase-like protein